MSFLKFSSSAIVFCSGKKLNKNLVTKETFPTPSEPKTNIFFKGLNKGLDKVELSLDIVNSALFIWPLLVKSIWSFIDERD